MEIPVRTRSLIERMRAAAFLETSVYEEVEADSTATTQAAIVVGIVSVCAAIGGARHGAGGLIAGLVSAYAGWAIWAAITYGIGTVLKGTATWGELLRTLGFAQSPGVLFVFGIIPILGGLANGLAAVWILVASVIAIRQALDFSTTRAIATAIVGFIPYLIIRYVVGAILGVTPELI